MTPEKEISQYTRRDIFDLLGHGEFHWSGNLDEVAFLARIFPLTQMPSTDSRPEFSTASADIRQHRINNCDWDDDWVFHDPRFNLASCPDKQFLEFLVQTIHPKVRTPKIATAMARKYNEMLGPYGYEFYPISNGNSLDAGHPAYSWRTASVRSTEIAALLDSATIANKEVMRRELDRVQMTIMSEPDAAIGECKNLLETLLKTILEEAGSQYGRDDLPSLYRATASTLGLESIPASTKASEGVRKSLRAMTTIVQSIAEIRNEIGDHHGSTSPSPAEPRHARLVLNSAIAVTEYLLDSLEIWRDQEHKP